MRMIADRANVSPTTVSLALRSHPSISEETQKRVKTIAKDLGYDRERMRPQVERQDKPKPTRIHYMVFGVELRDFRYAPFLDGLIETCDRLGIPIRFQSIPGTENSDWIELLPPQSADEGIIVAGRVNDSILRYLLDRYPALILMGNHMLSTPINSVETDLAKAMSQILDQIPENRLKDLVIAVNDPNSPFDRLILSQLHGSLSNLGLDLSGMTILAAGQNFETLDSAIAKLLALPSSSSPHYILTPQIHIAERILTELLRLGQNVPGDFEIVSLVNSSSPDQPYNPRIRLFALGTDRLGPLALERLDQMLRHPESPPSRTAIPPVGFLPFHPKA